MHDGAACSLERMNLGLTRSGTKLSIRKTRQRSRLGQGVWQGGCWCGAASQRSPPTLACPALLSKAHQAVCSAAQETAPLGGVGRGTAVHVQQQLPTGRNSHPGHPCAPPAGDRGAPDTGRQQQEESAGKDCPGGLDTKVT